jgi:STAS-like domain of unknown function (DUF4325)
MRKIRVEIFKEAGEFAEDKDAAARIREERLRAGLDSGGEVVLDFAGVGYATQSFIHAMIAQTVRRNPDVLERISFANCSDAVRGIVEIVIDYAQEGDL